jgi:site-specific recombinase XerD
LYKNQEDLIVQTWLNQVELNNLGSNRTKVLYSSAMTRFLESIGKTAEQILTDYETLPEKTFKRRYSQAIMDFVYKEKERGLCSSSYANALYAVKSFFKYNSLPLNFIVSPKVIVENHNRDIKKEEIEEIIKASTYRERAFFLLMAQSGLRPNTLTQLKIGNLEKILEENTPVPCLINVPQSMSKGKYGSYFTFCGQESVDALKDYFKTRENLTSESYVFVKANSEERVRAGDFTHFFRRIVKSLAEKNILKVKTKTKNIEVQTVEGKRLRSCVTRSDLRLYNLRKFFRKYAGQAGFDYVNFWMGHTLGVDDHYFSRDIEMHGKIYKEKAMPFLRIQTRTPSETEKQIEELRRENAKLSAKVLEIEASKDNLKAKVEEYEKNRPLMEAILRRLHAVEKRLQESGVGLIGSDKDQEE